MKREDLIEKGRDPGQGEKAKVSSERAKNTANSSSG